MREWVEERGAERGGARALEGVRVRVRVRVRARVRVRVRRALEGVSGG